MFRIDLAHAQDAKSLHRTLAKSLHFPDWYGANWDALADSLADMSWNEADGYLLILQRAEILQAADPACFEALLDVLKDTVMAWQAQKILLRRSARRPAPELSRLGVHLEPRLQATRSVLVLIHTPARQVLLIERAAHPGYWQSVTGSREGLASA